MNGVRTPRPFDTEVIRIGNERLKNHEANRPLTHDESTAWRASRARDIADEQHMAQWEARGFIGFGPPDERADDPDDRFLTEGGEWACEHGISGKHTPFGADRPCKVLVPNVEDWWLGDTDTPEHDATRDVRDYPYLARRPGTEAELASLKHLMEQTPTKVSDGGGFQPSSLGQAVRHAMGLTDGVLRMREGGETDAPQDS